MLSACSILKMYVVPSSSQMVAQGARGSSPSRTCPPRWNTYRWVDKTGSRFASSMVRSVSPGVGSMAHPPVFRIVETWFSIPLEELFFTFFLVESLHFPIYGPTDGAWCFQILSYLL